MSGADGSVIRWYRTPVEKQLLAELNRRSDVRGAGQSLGHLALMAATAALSLFSWGAWPWWATAAAVFLHGTVASFTINAMHELVHRSVFRTQELNAFFLRIYSFIGWHNFEHFSISHMRHHQYTLHPPDDGEVVLPIRIVLWHFARSAVVNPLGGYEVLRTTVLHALGRFDGEWNARLFPGDQPGKRRPAVRWARWLLAGHAVIITVSLSLGWWLVPVLTRFTPWYGAWLFFLCNNTQHIGLQDRVPDFRLCCRTFTVNPVIRFLYWQMNFHTEHHMYAAVPCYNLARLHEAIRHDLPPCPRGLRATWREIRAILKIQEKHPGYQHVAPLPVATAGASPQPFGRS
jgi:fatty acid desaturase